MTLEELIQELQTIRQLRGGEIRVLLKVGDLSAVNITRTKTDTLSSPYTVKIIAE